VGRLHPVCRGQAPGLDSARFLYKTTDYYSPAHERTLQWNDPQLAIPWPINGEPLLAAKDKAGTPLASAETFA
jgi:dTDP-4-dehydrorhamnose 3,5-epimerase